MSLPDLQTSLLDLLHEIHGTEIKLILGGGFGIYLKTLHTQRQGLRTLWKEWPEPRSTRDLDLFLRPELLISSEKLKPLAVALGRLGYRVVPSAQKYQFAKPGPEGGEAGSIKIDLLTGPRSSFKDTGVRVDSRRVRPTPSIDVHAHPVDEAPTLEEKLIPLTVDGMLSSGVSWKGEILLPHPYTFLMMKLFAFKDRLNDADREFGRYHALDLYTILATTTEGEWRDALLLRDRSQSHRYVLEAASLVATYFNSLESLGMLRLRESPYYRDGWPLREFMSVLKELFPSSPAR